jgi:hypothetical protein
MVQCLIKHQDSFNCFMRQIYSPNMRPTIRRKERNYLQRNWNYYYGAYSPLLNLGRFFSFLILYTVGRTPWMGVQPVTRPLSTYTQNNTNTQWTSMPWIGFEPMIPALERVKTVHAFARGSQPSFACGPLQSFIHFWGSHPSYCLITENVIFIINMYVINCTFIYNMYYIFIRNINYLINF